MRLYFCLYLNSIELMLKHGLFVNMPVVTTGYLRIITMRQNVISALAELLLYSAPGLSAQWVRVGPGAFAGPLIAHMLIFLSPF